MVIGWGRGEWERVRKRERERERAERERERAEREREREREREGEGNAKKNGKKGKVVVLTHFRYTFISFLLDESPLQPRPISRYDSAQRRHIVREPAPHERMREAGTLLANFVYSWRILISFPESLESFFVL
jgi:hypothetical protein